MRNEKETDCGVWSESENATASDLGSTVEKGRLELWEEWKSQAWMVQPIRLNDRGQQLPVTRERIKQMVHNHTNGDSQLRRSILHWVGEVE
jgi:hypothetical protein